MIDRISYFSFRFLFATLLIVFVLNGCTFVPPKSEVAKKDKVEIATTTSTTSAIVETNLTDDDEVGDHLVTEVLVEESTQPISVVSSSGLISAGDFDIPNHLLSLTDFLPSEQYDVFSHDTWLTDATGVFAQLSAKLSAERSAKVSTNTLNQSTTGIQVAVLLPLSGKRYSRVGRQIQQGIMMQYYASKKPFAKIRFFDTEKANIQQLYAEAQQAGYHVVIGPLTSNNVNTLQYSSQTVNLVLNQSKRAQNSSANLPTTYFLNFTEENEVQQISDEAEYFDVNNIVLFVEDNPKGKRFADQFVIKWRARENNGRKNKVANILYASKQYNKGIKMLEKYLRQTSPLITFAQNAKGNTIIKSTQEKDDFPFIRQDVDALVTSLPLTHLQLIPPLLRLIGGVPPKIISTSKITKKNFRIKNNQDTDQIYFLDSPWRYQTPPKTFFTALGEDVFRLASFMLGSSRFIYHGLTGKYYFVKYHSMRQRLNWYYYNKEGIDLISTP